MRQFEFITHTSKLPTIRRDSEAQGDLETFAHPTLAVIIPVFNQARFLADAIMSVLAQTRPANQIIVVDDGSTDDPAGVVAQFPTVRLIRTENRGPSAARNTGLRNCTASYVVFCDADDRLLPTALETGLACMAANPNCAFVHGGYRGISEDGRPLGGEQYTPIGEYPHLTLLLKGNNIGIMTALFRRDCLLAVNGFDESLRRGEDDDLYFRIVQKYAIASHPEVVGEYRRHSQNVSNDPSAGLKAALHVLDLHEARIASDDCIQSALRQGRAGRQRFFVSRMLDEAFVRWRQRQNIWVLAADLIQAARWSPLHTIRSLLPIRSLLRALGRRAIRFVSIRVTNKRDT
jgi:glycosyltransferase involved in cell wall biosynthesis